MRHSCRIVAISQVGSSQVARVVGITLFTFFAGCARDLAFQGNVGHVLSLTTSPDGALLATGGSDRILTVWDASTGAKLFALSGHHDFVSSVAFSGDGKRIASGSGDHTVKLWDVETTRELSTLRHTDNVTSVSFVPNRQLLASGSADGTVKLWDVSTLGSEKEVAGLKAGTAVLALAVSPDGAVLASGQIDGKVTLWDLATNRVVRTLRLGVASANTVTFSSNGDTLAAGGGGSTDSSDGRRYHGEIRLWDVATGRESRSINVEEEEVNSVAFSHDSVLLAAGCDYTTRIWDARSKKLLSSIDVGVGVRSVAFLSAGQMFVVGRTGHNPIKVYDSMTGNRILNLRTKRIE